MNSEVREEMRLLQRVGWQHQGATGSDHQAIFHPAFGRHTLPSSPSDHRWRKNQRRDIAQRMGMSVRELEIEMGVATEKSTSDRPDRTRNVNGVHVHNIKLAGGMSGQEERPARTPGQCEHGVDYDRQCFDCGRTFEDLPKLCEHRVPMEEACWRCNREAKPKHPCKRCGKDVPQTNTSRPRLYCDAKCRNADRNQINVAVDSETYKALGPNPCAVVRTLIAEYIKEAK